MDREEPDWQAYEREAYDAVRSKFPTAIVRHDVRLRGRFSDVPRQVDILVEEERGGRALTTAIEARRHGRKVSVKDVEAFLGFVRDVGVDRGIMLSASGYTTAAARRVLGDDVDVDLDVFSLAEFTEWQSGGGLPYMGENGAVIDAPLGWVLDPHPDPEVPAALYRRGSTMEQALRERELMYVHSAARREIPDLEALLALQEADLLGWDPHTVITTSLPDLRSDFRTCIRRAKTAQYPVDEITGFVEFPDSILFVVLFSPEVGERRNLRKLEYVLRTAIPFQMIRIEA